MIAQAEKQTLRMTRATAPRPGAVQVLVVDDDACLRELLYLHLWRAGYGVRLAEDAIEAGRLILEASPDIMIVDVSMPYMDGFEFVAAVRTDRTIPFFPVIFLGAHTNAATRAREFGAVCLLKPVQGDRLLTAVASRVSIQRPQGRFAADYKNFSPELR